jgi:mRNA export factor
MYFKPAMMRHSASPCENTKFLPPCIFCSFRRRRTTRNNKKREDDETQQEERDLILVVRKDTLAPIALYCLFLYQVERLPIMTTFAPKSASAASAETKDFKLTNPGADSTSALAWSPLMNQVAAGNWSSEVLVWNLRDNSGSKMEATQVLKGRCAEGAGLRGRNPLAPRAASLTVLGLLFLLGNHGNAPVLDVCYYPDGKALFSVGGDNNLRHWNLERPTDKAAILGSHDKPIKTVGMLGALAVTGGWDNKVKFWDGRTHPKPVGEIDLMSPIYAMDVDWDKIVLATGDRKLHVIDNRINRSAVVQSNLQSQIRCLAWCHDMNHVATGGIEGVVCLENFQGSVVPPAFPHHQQGRNAFAINAISFNKKHGFLATAGTDCVIQFWDPNTERGKRLVTFPPTQLPISAAKFNETGSLFAYACSYDWSKGSAHAKDQKGNEIFIHRVSVDEKPKAKKTSNRPVTGKQNKNKSKPKMR